MLPSGLPATSWYASANAKRWPWLGLLCLGLLLGFAFQGSRGLWSTDEGRYVDGALQMLDSGNYLVPAYSPIEVNLSKPPLTYWVIAASFELFGRNTWAARAPYALAFAATIWLIYGMGLRLFPDKPWLPGLVYALSLAPFLGTNVVSTDVLLTLCEALAMYGFLVWTFAPDGRRMRAWLLLMWLGWGLAFLTKGPPGLLPLLAVIPFVAIRDGWRGIARLFPPLGILLFIVVGLGWFAVVVLRVPWALHYLLHREMYERIFTSVQHRNAGPWGWLIVYFPTVILGSLPWWPGLVPAFFARLRGRAAKTRDASEPRAGVSLLLWLWFGIPFVVFCLARSRLPAYVLPLFIPLSLGMVRGLASRVDLHKNSWRAGLAVWIVALLACKGGVAYALQQPQLDNRLIARELNARVVPDAYSAVVFVQATAAAYDIEEATPWGVRLYLDKPVYAVAWLSQGGPATLCRAVQRAGSALVVVANDLVPVRTQVSRTLSQCTRSGAIDAGTWRRQPLILARM